MSVVTIVIINGYLKYNRFFKKLIIFYNNIKNLFIKIGVSAIVNLKNSMNKSKTG